MRQGSVPIMRFINWLLGIGLFILALGLAIKNSHAVIINYFLGYQISAPLILILLVVLIAGVVLGVVACSSIMLKQQRELRVLRGLSPLGGESRLEREP